MGLFLSFISTEITLYINNEIDSLTIKNKSSDFNKKLLTLKKYRVMKPSLMKSVHKHSIKFGNNTLYQESHFYYPKTQR